MNPGFRRRALVPASVAVALLVVAPAIRSALGTVYGQEAHRAPVEVTVTAKKYSFSPARIEVQQDDIVKITLKTEDIPHSFTVDHPYLIAKRAAAGQPVTFEFRADRPGTFTYYCNLTADDGCRQMKGELVVRAKPQTATR
ncbi:MAG: cupredoxin domain-containing protein [Bacteroidales bacterium]